MDIFDFAMKMEKDGQAYYESLAQQAENAVLKSILQYLAQAEVIHYETFKKFKEGDVSNIPDFQASGTQLLKNAKNVFEQIAERKEDMEFPSDVVAAWEKAREVEKESEAFYREKAPGAENETIKNAILLIADEEHTHWALIENIVEFLNQPKQWLENAEWHHFADY